MNVQTIQHSKIAESNSNRAQKSLVKEIALKCLTESTVSLACTFAVSFFAIPLSSPTLLSAFFFQTLVGICLNPLSALAFSKNYQKIGHSCEWITAFSFSVSSAYNVQILIHELGHAAAACLLYQNARPSIYISPFAGAITQMHKKQLSSIGKSIGAAAATCIFFASGPGFTLLVSSALLAIGLSVKEIYPQLSKQLIAWALFDFLHTGFYAYTALSAHSWDLHHDFVQLAIFGLSPTAATVGILAIPILIVFGNWYMSLSKR